MTDMSNRKTLRRAEKAAAIAESNRIAFTRTIMSTPFGREWMHGLLADCNVFHTPFVAGHSDTTAFNCGAQNLGLRRFADVVTHCPDQYVIMMQEQATKDHLNDRYDSDDRSADTATAATGTAEVAGRDDPGPDERDPASFVDEHGFVNSRPN
jgi:hypothetical protein